MHCSSKFADFYKAQQEVDAAMKMQMSVIHQMMGQLEKLEPLAILFDQQLKDEKT
mgnify:CR=1 FL=1